MYKFLKVLFATHFVVLGFILSVEYSHATQMDFAFKTPNGEVSVVVTLRNDFEPLDRGAITVLDPSAMKYFDVKENDPDAQEVRVDGEVLGYLYPSEKIKKRESRRQVMSALVSIPITGGSLAVGQVIALDTFSLEALVGIPLVCAFSFLGRLYAQDGFNLLRFSGFLKAIRGGREFSRTQVMPEWLKAPSFFEIGLKLLVYNSIPLSLVTVGDIWQGSTPAVFSFWAAAMGGVLFSAYEVYVATLKHKWINRGQKTYWKILNYSDSMSLGLMSIANLLLMVAKTGSDLAMPATYSLLAGGVVFLGVTFGPMAAGTCSSLF